MTTDAASAAIVPPLRAWHGLLWIIPWTALWTWLICALVAI
ncbi:hypothetical protein M2191_001492 [Bradyrhizobium japonicum]|nr:hypothetical protein [Bradyrhizobium japonicum]